MIRYGSKIDSPLIYQQNLSAKIFVSHKLHENVRINYLQRAKVLGEVGAEKKKTSFAVPLLRLTKLYEYLFLKMCRRIAFSQYDFVLPEHKTLTESWMLQELKSTFKKDVSKKSSTLLLPTNDIPNRNSETVNVTKEDLTTDEKHEIQLVKLLSYNRKKKPASRQLFFIRSNQFCGKIIDYEVKQIPFGLWFFNLL